MRIITLGVMLSELRAECGYSQNSAHGINNRDSLVQVLKRTQRRLWAAWDWMHLRVSRDFPAMAGQRYYNVPGDLIYERIDTAEFKFGGQWQLLCFGIDERNYSAFDPRVNERSWPVTNWDVAEDPMSSAGNPDGRGMIEIWPLPSDTGVVGGDLEGNVRFTGIRTLNPFEQDSDRCDLDADLLVLYAASEILMRDRKEDSQAKLAMAQQQFQMLKGNAEKNRTFSLGGDDPYDDNQQPITYAQPVPFSYRRP